MKNKNNLIVLVLVGVLLMVITLPIEDTEKTDSEKSNLQEINNSTSLTAAASNQDLTDGEGDYADKMEAKLEAVLEKMEGVGEVRVFITLQSSEEKIVEKDEPINRSNTAETDAEGGSRTINNVDAGESTVYTTEGNISTPYVVKTVTPQVEGVLVLAQGAGNGTVNKNIADAVQVLFGIEAHQVKVIKMESANSQE